MLKSLGVTFAQLSQRLRTGEGNRERGAARSARQFEAEQVLRRRERRRQVRSLIVLVVVFFGMVAAFSSLFHSLMGREGRSYSWATSVYWTLTTMTTLGFGDITFESDAGRIFSIVVLLSGSTFLLVMLPFVFIQFVFMPWMAERDRRRAPRAVGRHVSDHLVLTELGPVERALIDRARQADVPYVLIVDDLSDAVHLHDEGFTVMLGDLDDPDTYRRARVDESMAVLATRNDRSNTNVSFTVREIAPDVQVIATANAPASVDILELAGADHVVQLGEILGAAMAARTLGPDGRSHVIGEFAGLRIAEAAVAGTALAGATLAEAQLRARLGVGIIGVWQRGAFEVASGQTRLEDASVVLLAATPEQLAAYDQCYAIERPEPNHVVIIGGGRVGRAIARRLEDEGISYQIVEQLAERRRPGANYVIGDAADREILDEAGLDRAGAVLITTHDDDVNVYLTRYCRGLRPGIRLVSRAKLDRNVSTLYRAGADAVLSYAGTCSAAIWNHLRGDETLLVAQGLNVFRTPIPRELIGRTLAESHLHARTGCNVVAIEQEGEVRGNPDAHRPLLADVELILIGTDTAEARFSQVFRHARRRVRSAGSLRQTERP